MQISTIILATLAGFSLAMPSLEAGGIAALQGRSENTHSTLGNGEWLLVGNSLFSQDGSVEFKMQGDGKIVIYYGGQPTWQNTNAQRNDVKGLIMQGDGNCILYTKSGQAIWQTNTAVPSGGDTSVATIRNDGTFSVYKGNTVFNVGPKKN